MIFARRYGVDVYRSFKYECKNVPDENLFFFNKGAYPALLDELHLHFD
jgi:hypothetical protein